MLVIGTTGAVYPAAGLPEAAIASGVPVIELNLDHSPISSAATVFLQVHFLLRPRNLVRATYCSAADRAVQRS